MPSLPRLAPGRGVARPQKTVHGVVHDRAIARRTFYSSLLRSKCEAWLSEHREDKIAST